MDKIYYIISVGKLEQEYDTSKGGRHGSFKYKGASEQAVELHFPTIVAAVSAAKLAELEYWEVLESKDNDGRWRSDYTRAKASPAVLAYEHDAEIERLAKVQVHRDRVAKLNTYVKVFSLATFKDYVDSSTLQIYVTRDDATLEDEKGTGDVHCNLTVYFKRSNVGEDFANPTKPWEWRYIHNYFTNTGQVRKMDVYHHYKEYIGEHFIDEVIREMKGIYFRYKEVKEYCSTIEPVKKEEVKTCG